jgi:alpha-beta hydrolase superfamily lysophospholipase
MAAEDGTIDIPLLITHGTADAMTCPRASAAFFDKVVCADKTYRAFPGAYHNCILKVVITIFLITRSTSGSSRP